MLGSLRPTRKESSWRAGRALLLVVVLLLAFAASQPGKKSVPNDPMLDEEWYLFAPGDKLGSRGQYQCDRGVAAHPASQADHRGVM